MIAVSSPKVQNKPPKPPQLAASLFCVFRKSSGSRAMFAAIRRALSLESAFAAPGD